MKKLTKKQKIIIGGSLLAIGGLVAYKKFGSGSAGKSLVDQNIAVLKQAYDTGANVRYNRPDGTPSGTNPKERFDREAAELNTTVMSRIINLATWTANAGNQITMSTVNGLGQYSQPSDYLS
jgi:hypothetical protein